MLLALVAAGVVVGIGLGLFLGWQVWPVQWYNTDPSDLRVQHQTTYTLMVADSFALTGDVGLARHRLNELVDQDTTWEQVANLVEQAAAARDEAGDEDGAFRSRQMAQALQLPPPDKATFQPPGQSAALPYRSYLLLLFVGIFAVALGVVVWLIVRLIKSRPRRVAPIHVEGTTPEPAPEAPAAQAPGPRPPTAPWEIPEPMAPVAQAHAEVTEGPSYELPHEPTAGPMPGQPGLAEAGWEAPEAEEPLPVAIEPRSGPSDIPSYEPPAEPTATLISDREMPGPPPLDALQPREELPEGFEAVPELVEEPPPAAPIAPTAISTIEEIETLIGDREEAPAVVPPEPARAQRPGAVLPHEALGIFEAEYRFGDDDFDSSFSVETEDGEFLGECGVGISDVLEADDAQHVDAFEIWLFDKGDIRTISKVLVSEYAYQDEALHARLSAKGELVVAQPGLSITLSTLALQVTAVIMDCGYLPDDSAFNSAFSHLAVKLIVERTTDYPQ